MPGGTGAAYPTKYESAVLLRDGSKIWLRPIRKDDSQRWIAFIRRLGVHTRYLRFHHVPGEMGIEEADRFCSVDYVNSFAVVAEAMRGQNKEIVGIGRYFRLPDGRSAEMALVVEDDYQKKGLGTRLIESLAKAALDNRITTFEADVLTENEEMMTVLGDYGFQVTSDQPEAGVYHITFPVSLSTEVTKKEG